MSLRRQQETACCSATRTVSAAHQRRPSAHIQGRHCQSKVGSSLLWLVDTSQLFSQNLLTGQTSCHMHVRACTICSILICYVLMLKATNGLPLALAGTREGGRTRLEVGLIGTRSEVQASEEQSVCHISPVLSTCPMVCDAMTGTEKLTQDTRSPVDISRPDWLRFATVERAVVETMTNRLSSEISQLALVPQDSNTSIRTAASGRSSRTL